MLHGGEQCYPRQGCSDLRQLPNIISAPVTKEGPYSLCADLRLWLPVYPHLLLCCLPIATGLEVIGWDKGWLMSCAWLCLKWSRFAWSQPHSLILAGLIQQQDKIKTVEDQRGCRSCQKVMNMPINRLWGSTPDFLLGFTPLHQGKPATNIYLPDLMIWWVYTHIHITECWPLK